MLRPVRVHLSHIASLATSDQHVVALRTDGTVWSWGYNVSGQLGRPTLPNDFDPHPTPTPVPGLTGIRAVAAGGEGSYALRQQPSATRSRYHFNRSTAHRQGSLDGQVQVAVLPDPADSNTPSTSCTSAMPVTSIVDEGIRGDRPSPA